MKGFVLVGLLIVAVNASLIEKHQALFETFKVNNGKSYRNQVEEVQRFNIFSANVLEIEQHNALYEQGLVSYKKAVNQFTDLTQGEFEAYLGLHVKPVLNNTIPYELKGLKVPTSVDWRSAGQVTGVKNQGSCGSCWSFSVTGSTEGAYYRKHKQLVSLSEQQLVDCSTNINYGCNGGFIDDTFPYIEQYGLQSESSYPYTGVDGSCKYDSSKVVTKVSNYVSLYGSESKVLEVVGGTGPVSIAMDASYLSSYSSGIYADSKCTTTNLNHAVLIVGYGSQNGQNYWIVKNSWGSSWGEQGYFRLLRGSNECGCAQDPVYPNIN
ncbi:procathepsin L-like isoform X3 [Anthonomus grandis grandis]|uniref:procathepsin L-like isoform X3 n=1 Tax=Anthonomus grandis grandis TaxID=2921223 RepID=UPI002165EF8D|nr:procathepsin L-like isoform X3 [Anthonomus grandis grandis]